MARALSGAGFTAVAASPHYGEGPGGDVPIATATARRSELREELAKQGVMLDVLANAEHHITAELFARVAAGTTVPIGGTGKWHLVELPWHAIPDPEAALFRLQTKGLRLLLAHPERYSYLSTAAIERLVARGVKMQVELGSFADVYGSRARKQARALVERGLAHVAASDLHRPQDAVRWVEAGIAAMRRHFGDSVVQRALVDNPRALLAGAQPEAVPSVAMQP